MPTLDDARAHLETLPQGELVELLIDHAHDDEALARKLLLRTATPTSAKADVASLRALIEQAFAHREFVPYREVWGYVRGIEEATDVLEAQFERGDGGDVVDLAEHALKLAERDLSIGYRFLQIAELCREHGEDDMALEWAERGMAAFAEDPDPRLRAFLIEEYRRRGRSAEALEHSAQAFGARPTLESYRELATDAKALGEWEERRRSALSLLGRPEPDPAGAMRHPSLRGHGCSELVRVLIWEGDPDAAWEAAGEGGCTRDLWLKLADLRRAEHPEDALGVYRRHVEDVIAGKDKRAYAEAVRLIDETMRALYAESGRPEGFDTYVEEVRTAHKPKRNLMKLMAGLEPARPMS